MARQVFVFDEMASRAEGRLVLKDEESIGQAPLFISDTMNPTLNHADGEIYTSRAAFRAAERASRTEGVSSQEALEGRIRRTRGDFSAKRNVLREAVEKAYYDRRDGRVPVPKLMSASDMWRGGGGGEE